MFQYYYPRTTYGLVVAFQNLFNDLTIKRYDNNYVEVKEIEVPIEFGPMDKKFKFKTEKEAGERYYLQLPRIAVTIGSMNYASDRTVGANEMRSWIKTDDQGSLEALYNDIVPTPYDITFNVKIRTESFEDFSQVIEQILPYFNPSLTLRVREFPTLGDDFIIERDINCVMSGVTAPEFSEDQGPEDVRFVDGSIIFTAQANFYKRLKAGAGYIEKITSNVHFGENTETVELP